MISAVIIDDEIRSCNTLTKLIHLTNQKVEILGEAHNVEDGYSLIQSKSPDLVFLDINMPGENGLSLVKKFEKIDFKIVFTTAHNEYAISAIKLGALDYLLKPISLSNLEETLLRAQAQLTKDHSVSYQEVMSLIQADRKSPTKIPIANMTGIDFIDSDKIVRCIADNNYTILHLNDKTQIVSSRTLKDYDKILTNLGFFRVHRSHLINLKYVSRYLKGKPSFKEMDDGFNVELAQNKKNNFLSLFDSA